MVIFGSRTWSKLIATLTVLCHNCHNPAAQHVSKRSTWFTLFFIPVIPLYVRRFVTCTYCGVSSKLTKAEAEQLVAAPPASPQQQPLPGQAPRP